MMSAELIMRRLSKRSTSHPKEIVDRGRDTPNKSIPARMCGALFVTRSKVTPIADRSLATMTSKEN